jgi:hypothetical protein
MSPILSQCKSPQCLILYLHHAFDSILCNALNPIFVAKGFPNCLCPRISSLNFCSQSTILWTVIPVLGFSLSQGDPLSPFHFIIVANVWKQVIIWFSKSGLISNLPTTPFIVSFYNTPSTHLLSLKPMTTIFAILRGFYRISLWPQSLD